jgi:hypothetical protein
MFTTNNENNQSSSDKLIRHVKFLNRQQSTTIDVDTFSCTYLVQAYPLFLEKLSLPHSTFLQIFCTKKVDGKLVQCKYDQNTPLIDMLELIKLKQLEYFEIFYKITGHGNQVADMSPRNDLKNTVVTSGYKRFVCGDGEKVQIGDVKGGGPYVTVPEKSGFTGVISVQTIESKDANDFLRKHGFTNVTKGVRYNPEANDFVNKK